MKRRTTLACTVLLLCMTGEARACSPDYYELDPMTMPTALFDVEVRRILGLPLESEYTRAEPYGHNERFQESRSADLEDLKAALGTATDAEGIVAQYKAMRDALGRHLAAYLNSLDSYFPEDAVRPAPMDLAPYEGSLVLLPEEFALYFRGAVAYHGGEWETATRYFKAVLELPEDARHYRSTWAAYMMGRTAMQRKSGDAPVFFEQARALAGQGFEDSLHLAEATVGWEARDAMDHDQFVQAIHLYAGLPDEAPRSLGRVCAKALDKSPIDPSLLTDALSRRLLSAWLVAFPSEQEKAGKWLNAVDAAALEGVVEGAEYLAWATYNRGDMERSAAWLTHADPASPYAKWIRAKLLLRDGKLEEAEALLDELGSTLPNDRLWVVQNPHQEEVCWPADTSATVFEDLGETRLARGDYSGALCAFMRADDWEDASFLAERVLTTEELRAFVDTHDASPELLAERVDSQYDERKPGWKREEIRYLLARRYAREGAWDEAIPFYPETAQMWLGWETASGEPLPPLAIQARDHYAGAHDTSLPPRTRAEHFLELAMLLRRKGAELLSPERIPPPGTDMAESAWPALTPEMQKRVEAAMAYYPTMNYFREMAADYAWEAARLLPNNDVLCAKALFYGGTFIKRPNPARADLFYKDLVRRNPNLLIAKQADEQRWFPGEFTDVVLYQPRTPDPWYGRKLYLAMGIVLLLWLDAMALLVFLWARRRRVAKGRTG